MTEQEKQLIEGLASRIHSAPAPEIDRDADTLIRNGIGGRPDALYILTQTVLVQEMALNQAMAQVEELKKRGAGTAPGSGSVLGSSVASAPGQPGGPPRQPAATAPAAPAPSPSPAPQYPAVQPPVAAQAPVTGSAGSGMSGFLRSAATTAAGVIAGEAAFSAISGLFGHHSGFGPVGDSGFLGAVSGVSPGSETIINNYYGEQREDRASDRDVDDSYDTATADDSDDSDDDSAQDDSAIDDSADDADSYDDGSSDPSDV